MKLKIVFGSLLMAMLLIACDKQEVAKERKDHTVLIAEGYPLVEDHSRDYSGPFTAKFEYPGNWKWDDIGYKASYSYKNGSSWTSLHPGIPFIRGNVWIPLTFPAGCGGAVPRRMIKVTTWAVGQPACLDIYIKAGGWENYVCQDPSWPYVDVDEVTLIAGLDHGYRFIEEELPCKDEGYITEGLSCRWDNNPNCN